MLYALDAAGDKEPSRERRERETFHRVRGARERGAFHHLIARAEYIGERFIIVYDRREIPFNLPYFPAERTKLSREVLLLLLQSRSTRAPSYRSEIYTWMESEREREEH